MPVEGGRWLWIVLVIAASAVLSVNAISFAALWILHRLGAGMGLVARRSVPSTAA
jgi:hypothetical protein